MRLICGILLLIITCHSQAEEKHKKPTNAQHQRLELEGVLLGVQKDEAVARLHQLAPGAGSGQLTMKDVGYNDLRAPYSPRPNNDCPVTLENVKYSDTSPRIESAQAAFWEGKLAEVTVRFRGMGQEIGDDQALAVWLRKAEGKYGKLVEHGVVWQNTYINSWTTRYVFENKQGRWILDVTTSTNFGANFLECVAVFDKEAGQSIAVCDKNAMKRREASLPLP